MSRAAVARTRLYETLLFREQVADRLCLNGNMVADAVDALLGANLLPFELSTNARSLAADGAAILMAIGCQQPDPDSIARIAMKFGVMRLQCEVGGHNRPVGLADIFPGRQSISFGTDLAELFLNLWKAAHCPSTSGFAGVSVSMLWSDERDAVLFGVVDQQKGKRQRIFATAPVIPAGISEQRDLPKLQTVGGTVFSPLSILRFGALLDASVADTAADFGNSTLSKRQLH